MTFAHRISVPILSLLLAVAFTTPAFAQSSAMGSGSAWFDCNNDGALDLLVLSPSGKAQLFIYDAWLDSFEDVSETALPSNVRNGRNPWMGVACADFDNDGFDDAFLTADGQNSALMNNGDGTFRFEGRASGIQGGPAGEALSASVAVLDYNNDGLLDVYVGNYFGTPNQFFRNDGKDPDTGLMRFVDVAPALGMDIPNNENNTNADWTLGLAVADYDNDGDVDLYVANDYDGISSVLNPGPNVLYRNNGDGTFTDVSIASGADDDGWAMGVSFADYDGDGWLDIFLANFWEDALLRNNHDGTFTNVTNQVGLLDQEKWDYNGWGSNLFDYDNDGDLDIHVANGYIPNGTGQVFNEPNQLWENEMVFGVSVNYKEVSAKSGLDDVGDGRGAAYADFNQDGLLDIMVVNNNAVSGGGLTETPERILHVNLGDGTFADRTNIYGIRDDFDPGQKPPGYRGFTDNNWIQIRPVGYETKTPVGARVSVTVDGRTWIQDYGMSSYCSQNSPWLHFGLGKTDVIDAIEVRFPSGRVYRETNVAPDQILTIDEAVTPVRLLSFSITPVETGARIAWSFADDGDLVAFDLYRDLNGVVETVARGVTGGRDIEVIDTGVPADRTVVYRLEALLRNGTRQTVRTESYRSNAGSRLALGPVFPNPFSSSTLIPILGATGGGSSIEIFDATGRLVRQLAVTPGATAARWDGKDELGGPVPAGVYFYRLEGADRAQTLKVIHQR